LEKNNFSEMKVLLINKFLYPKGGDAISTINTGNLLASHGHEAMSWGIQHPKNPFYPNTTLLKIGSKKN